MPRLCESKTRAGATGPLAADRAQHTRSSDDNDKHRPETTLIDLPVEVLVYIASFMGTRDAGACAMTSRALAVACDDHALWKRLCDVERAVRPMRVRAAVEAAAQALAICGVRDTTNWSPTQKGQFVKRLAKALTKDVNDALCSAWYAKIDLAIVLGHPRFACAMHARIRVVADTPFTSSPSGDPLSTHRDYKTVGTLIRCKASGHASSVCEARIDCGFFDAVGVMCGPGVSYAIMPSHDLFKLWRGCVSTWQGGSPSSVDTDVLYARGIAYRGSIADGRRHGYGRLYDSSGNLLVAGNWKDDRPHGFCSWRAHHHTTSSLVASALFVAGFVDGPVAYFAHGRLVAVDHWRLGDRTLDSFVLRCPPLGDTQRERAHGVLVAYTPSGATLESRGFFVHRWPDGAVVAGRTRERGQDGMYDYKPVFFIQGRDSVRLGNRYTVERNPYTLALTLSAFGPTNDPFYDVLCRDRTQAVDVIARDVNVVMHADRHLQGDHLQGNATDDDRDGDFALQQQDFEHAIAAVLQRHSKVERRNVMSMNEQERTPSDNMAARFDCLSAIQHNATDCTALRRGRLHDALYVDDGIVHKRLDMTRCALRGCVFVGATFHEVDFRGTRFDECVFYHCSFVRCALFGATFDGSSFHDCCLAFEADKGPAPCEQRFDVDTAAARCAMAVLGATFS